MDVLQQLREATREHHNRIENDLPLLREGLTLPDYSSVLLRFYGFYQPLERALRAAPNLESAGVAMSARWKTHLLAADITALDLERRPPLCEALPLVDTRARALGCLYVLEGSTLGGQIVSRWVDTSLGLRSDNGCAFFNSYGDRVGRMWRDFCSTLRSRPEDERLEMVGAARETFDCFSAWLRAGW